MSTATLPKLLESLRQSVASVAEATPKLSALAPPEDGLSLLDVKNELLLSYLEHMVFLIVLKLRRAATQDADESAALSLASSDVGQSVVNKLVELRLYLEKGVRPLEDKLRYQVEKALRAAEDVERAARQKQDAAAAAAADEDDSESDASGSDDGNGGHGGNDDDGAGFGDEEAAAGNRPNRAAFVRPKSATESSTAKTAGAEGGVYRPPKIAPTVMPDANNGRRERRRPIKSATMDEFVADELSSAPMAEVSVGANIAQGGRHMTTAKERQREDERREYEERNFVRLPAEGKKARKERNRAEGRSSQMTFGGEEWRGLGDGVDRINRLTQRRPGGSAGGSTRTMLDKSRKRGIDTVDGPRGSGLADTAIGGRFSKKLRHHEMGSHRDRKKQ